MLHSVIHMKSPSRWFRDAARTVGASLAIQSALGIGALCVLLGQLHIVAVVPMMATDPFPQPIKEVLRVELPPYREALHYPPELQRSAGGPAAPAASQGGIPMAATEQSGIDVAPDWTSNGVADGSGDGPADGGNGVGDEVSFGIPSGQSNGVGGAAPEEEPFVEFADEEPVYDDVELMRRIRYPEMAKAATLEGHVTLRVRINSQGGVASVDVIVASHSIFIQAAVDAVQGTTFIPARSGGQAVASMVVIPIRFSLR